MAFLLLSPSFDANGDAYSAIGIGYRSLNSDGTCVKGIFLTPPGYGLLMYSRRIGASFTPEGLGNKVHDVMVRGLELADRVEVKYASDHVRVSVHDIKNSAMCDSLRKKSHKLCEQVGCPICSMVSCMVVECMGRRAIVKGVHVDGKRIDLDYRLL